MECYLICFDGQTHRLPPLTRWSFRYGPGEACDSFELEMVFDGQMLPILERSARFRAQREGQTVFYGLVDEYETDFSENGGLVTVRGRGLQALLLDNEVESASYFSAGVQQVLESYVYPFGVTQVSTSCQCPAVALTVSSGSSAWGALSEYMRFACGTQPRFSRDGTLLLGEHPGQKLRIGQLSARGDYGYTHRRYGVVSRVIVKNKVLGTRTQAVNSRLEAQGLCCQRIVNVPRYVGFDAMRYTGQYQIRRSRQGSRQIRIQLLKEFAASPGDVAELSGIAGLPEGEFMVSGSVCFAGEGGAGTELTLTEGEDS